MDKRASRNVCLLDSGKCSRVVLPINTAYKGFKDDLWAPRRSDTVEKWKVSEKSFEMSTNRQKWNLEERIILK